MHDFYSIPPNWGRSCKVSISNDSKASSKHNMGLRFLISQVMYWPRCLCLIVTKVAAKQYAKTYPAIWRISYSTLSRRQKGCRDKPFIRYPIWSRMVRRELHDSRLNDLRFNQCHWCLDHVLHQPTYILTLIVLNQYPHVILPMPDQAERDNLKIPWWVFW